MNTCLYFLLITFVLLNSLPSIRHVDNFLSISLKGGGGGNSLRIHVHSDRY